MAWTSALPDMAPEISARPTVNSFDVFDTLIARRCVRPQRVFELVEARTGLRGFAKARMEAEASLAGAPYTIDMIYEALCGRLVLGNAQTQALKSVELAIESENVIPITENMSSVADGDILISDMYLSPDDIRGLLAKAGFERQVSLIVSSDGKRSGKVWPEVLKIFALGEHLGDDAHTDVRSPSQAGVRCRRSDVAKPSPIENVLMEIGLQDLAALAREARLKHWSTETDLRALQLAQASYNLPILTIAAVKLLRLADKLGMKRILFSSRDCNLWLPVCQAVAAAARMNFDMRYFFTSRMTRVKPSDPYLDYARAAIDSRTLVVDLCGTGWSLAHLFRQIGRRDQHVAFLQRLHPRADYESVARTPDTAIVHQLLADVEGCNNTAIEMCNYARHGMVVDVREALGCEAAVFAPDHRSDRVRAAISAQQAVAACYMASLREHGLAETLAASEDALASVGGALYKGLSRNQAVYMRFLSEHNDEDLTARRALGCAV